MHLIIDILIAVDYEWILFGLLTIKVLRTHVVWPWYMMELISMLFLDTYGLSTNIVWLANDGNIQIVLGRKKVPHSCSVNDTTFFASLVKSSSILFL